MDLNHPSQPADRPAQHSGAGDGSERATWLVAGDFLLTINPVDGSEIVPCPPGRRPPAPRRTAATGAGQPEPGPPLLDREEQRARLRSLLASGRSVRLTGPSGAGRSALLAAVAEDCATLAPDGVVRLSGHRRTPRDLLHELYAAVHQVANYRPGPTELSSALREVGAVVVLDDVEFGGAALDELLNATPECAFLLAQRPEAPAPGASSGVADEPVAGIGPEAGRRLLALAVARELTAAEAEWADELGRAGGGLPRHFVQAGAVLRYRALDGRGPLPSVDALVTTLAASISDGARELLRIGLALGGELPDPAALPALTGDAEAATAHTELDDCGLLTRVGRRRRLEPAATAAFEGSELAAEGAARTAALTRHYSWWLAESGTSADEVVAQADVVLAALRAAQQASLHTETTELVRRTAPLLAAGLRWGAWERALRTGQEAARASGAVAQEAYFHHELGVLAICEGQLARARVELEASTALRGVLSDAGGAVAGRRALTLVDDLTRAPAQPPAHTPPFGAQAAVTQQPPPEVNGDETPVGLRAPEPPGQTELTLTIRGRSPEESGATLRRMFTRGNRRNAVATGAGALLAAVLGTVVALGLTSGDPEDDTENVTRDDPATSEEDAPTVEETEKEGPATEEEEPTEDPTSDEPTTPEPTEDPTTEQPPPPDPTTEDPTPSESGGSDDGAGGGQNGGGGGGGGDTDPPTESPDPPTDDPEDPPTDDPPTEDPDPDPPTEDPEDPPTEGDDGGPDASPTAGEPTPTATVTSSHGASATVR
ncbi:ATP-binding protein [Streptomyces sedi]|uniref:ATP-binding protein n=1 Tax=Streptomyces sedi TaxID=555059 RepID=A0A5C4VE32_9ACTN|nr:ATP-binding protein [Streptomyces sedi]TNM34143.1 ATP-binding protein [Streptomyces sedi]